MLDRIVRTDPLDFARRDRAALDALLPEVDDLAVTLIANSRDCVKLMNRDGTLVYMSAQGQCAMEVPSIDALLGRSWIDLWPEDLRDMIRQAVESAAAGKAERLVAGCPTCLGTPRIWDVTVSAIFTGSGEGRQRSDHLIAASRDVTAAWAEGLHPEAAIPACMKS